MPSSLSSSSNLGWQCSRCTYEHHAPGTRCVMCNELRINKEQIRDFIQGKPIPDSSIINTSTIAATNNNNNNNSSRSNDTTTVVQSKSTTTIRKNPYAARSSNNNNNSRSNSSNNNHNNNSTSNNTTMNNNLSQSSLLSTSRQQQQTTILDFQSSQTQSNNMNETTTSKPSLPKLHKRSNSNSNNLSQSSLSSTTTTRRQQQQTILHFQPKVVVQSNTNNNNSTSTTTNSVAATRLKTIPKPVVAVKSTATTKTKMSATNNATNVNDNNKSKPKRQQSVFRPVPTSVLPFHPGPVPYDIDSAKTWIYPSTDKYPKRQYQYEIAQTAVLNNTLVSLPTGLGKTLIAAVVLYNYYRWFPTGKVIFFAPTLPLVDQQVQACYEIMGIPPTDTAILTGKVSGQQRTKIWKNKCVFFCTPQTVHKDFEQKRIDAKQIVCIVLDEAHKATGEYAYCKVIKYLESAGAKFRILGLSATPGTSIKNIQQVVNVLRINCIEARNDDDVKQYIHERHNEVVIVKQVEASKTVERILDSIIGPILDRLRQSKVLPSKLASNASITPFAILQARKHYLDKPKMEQSPSILGYVAAGLKMVQIRSDLHKQGIGIARNKLLTLQNERQTGYLSTIIKSTEFKNLMIEIHKATTTTTTVDNNSSGNYDNLKNNPKLIKLREILTEHFERAKACDQSSRAIVFSQFRDSVSEITNVLDNSCLPLIRARHFIGQGKGTTAKTNNDNNEQNNNSNNETTSILVKGMKQEEQKAVINEFRSGIYNVLVCTCIGEEGLDIGEVDLIINFDCLSSPIRMIQRIGRTGRKRQGRVVTLVAEGPEERTLSKSKQNERNLAHALKNPKSFTVSPLIPTFPHTPVVCEKDMCISKNFHMSQVDGAGMKKKKKRKSNNRKSSIDNSNWILSEQEESERQVVIGQLRDLHADLCANDNIEGSMLLSSNQQRRRFASAKLLSYSSRTKEASDKIELGTVSNLLRIFEQTYSNTKQDCNIKKRSTGIKRNTNRSLLDKIFPLSISLTDLDTVENSAMQQFYTTYPKPPYKAKIESMTTMRENQRSVNHGNGGMFSNSIQINTTGSDINVRVDGTESNRVETSCAAFVNSKTSDTIPYGVVRQDVLQTNVSKSVVTLHSNSTAKEKTIISSSSIRSNPYSSRRKEGTKQPPCDRQKHNITAQMECSTLKSIPQKMDADVPLNHHNQLSTTKTVVSSATLEQTDYQGKPFQPQGGNFHVEKKLKGNERNEFVCSNSFPKEQEECTDFPSSKDDTVAVTVTEKKLECVVDEFCLPSQDESSSDESDNDDGQGKNKMKENNAEDGNEDLFCLPTQSSDDEDNSNASVSKMEQDPSKVEDSFCLPTPDSSSSEDESEEGDAKDFGLPDPDMQTELGTQLSARGNTKKFSLDSGIGSCFQEQHKLNFEFDSRQHEYSKTDENKVVQKSIDVSFNEVNKSLPSNVPANEVCAKNDSSYEIFTINDTPEPNMLAKTGVQETSPFVARDKTDLQEEACQERTAKKIDEAATSRVRFSIDNSVREFESCKSTIGTLTDTPDSVIFPPKIGRRRKILAIVDTPNSEISENVNKDTCVGRDLSNNQDNPCCDVENVVCAVCNSNSLSEEDPIILCDGPGNGLKCDVAVHTTCYSAIVDLLGDSEWYCDPCLSIRKGEMLTIPRCSLCTREAGALKRCPTGEWRHVRCPSIDGGKRLKRLRRQKKIEENAENRKPLLGISANEGFEGETEARKKRRRENFQRFIDYEAVASDGDSDEDEERHVLDIEEEEKDYSSFINDSSQLGYTQDELDRVDPNEENDNGALHRAVDLEREKQQQFATPRLNRLQETRPWSGSQSTAADSAQGLGKMHFIKSVLDHHRNGGCVDDIENFYNETDEDNV